MLISATNHNLQWLKGALSGLRQFLTTESPLKMMKKAFYFTSEALCSQNLKLLKLSGHVSKQLDYKDKVNFKFYDDTAWLNTHIAQYLEK